MMIKLDMGEWMPDMAVLDSNQGEIGVAKNVVPRTIESYGPLPSFTIYSNAIGARCQGGGSGYQQNTAAGTVFNFAGDATKLYKLVDATWSDVSVGGGYSIASTDTWRFAQFGNRFLATDFAEDIQTWTMGASAAFAALAAGTAPKAKHLAVWNYFTVAGYTNDAGNGIMNDGIWWSAINDPTLWPTPGTAAAAAVQSGNTNIRTGRQVKALIGACGGADGIIFMDSAIWRAVYAGPPVTFDFVNVERNRGLYAENSVINLGSQGAGYLSEDGFFIFTGAGSLPIGAGKVDRFFFDDLDPSYPERVYGAADPLNHLMYWLYPGSGNTSGLPNHLIIFNWALNRWAYGEQAMEILFRSLSNAYTLEGLDAISTSIDALPASLDARAWRGGNAVLTGFNSAHKSGYLNGTNLSATLQSSEYRDPTGNRFFLRGIRPLVDGGVPTVTLLTRDTPQGVAVAQLPVTVDADGVGHMRKSARYARAQVDIPAAAWNHFKGIEVDLDLEGLR